MSSDVSPNKRLYSYIRFSTPEQLKGDSLRRQLALAEDYAEKNGLALIEIQDLGLSAFKPDHRRRGNLGKFLKLVESGDIPEGSTLLLESFDRLSREAIMDSLAMFTSIVSAGITIVTLSDGERVYTKESINDNPFDLMMTIMILSRGHEESKIKSERQKAVWETRRSNSKDRPLTATCPTWLKVEKGKFSKRPERVRVVQHVFELYTKRNLGYAGIVKELKREGFDSWRKDGGWALSTIRELIQNRAVIGEKQNYTMSPKGNRKRIPCGEPIVDFYPKIIEDAVFDQAQRIRRNRRNTGGRKQNEVINLFQGLVFCDCCGSKMYFQKKGSGKQLLKERKGPYFYLECASTKRGLACENKPWNYFEFEESMIKYTSGINWDKVLTPEDQASKNKALEDSIDRSNEEISRTCGKLNNITRAIEAGIDFDQTLKRAQEIKESLKEMEARVAELKAQLQESNNAQIPTLRFKMTSVADIKTMSINEKQDIQRKIKYYISRIDIFSRKNWGRSNYDRAARITHAKGVQHFFAYNSKDQDTTWNMLISGNGEYLGDPHIAQCLKGTDLPDRKLSSVPWKAIREIPELTSD